MQNLSTVVYIRGNGNTVWQTESGEQARAVPDVPEQGQAVDTTNYDTKSADSSNLSITGTEHHFSIYIYIYYIIYLHNTFTQAIKAFLYKKNISPIGRFTYVFFKTVHRQLFMQFTDGF